MRREAIKSRRGFTLTELTATIALAAIAILAMGAVLVDSQRGWQRTFSRVFGDVVTDGYVARKTFDAIVRKSSYTRERIDDDWVEVYYYNDPDTSVRLDRYAKFYKSGDKLFVDYGNLDASGNPTGHPSAVTLARNVQDADFSLAGTSIQMVLQLDNGDQQLTVLTAAVRHNE